MSVDRAIQSTRVVTHEGVRPATVIVRSGRVTAVIAHGTVTDGVPLDDWGDLAVLPGFVDTHVHCNEPGRTDWEGFETATRAAIAGGITTIVDMPLNSSPVTTTVEAFEQKLAAAEGKLWCDVGFWGGVVPGNLKDIEPLIQAGVLGFKAFLCDSGIDEFPAAGEAELRAVMPILSEAGLPLLAHAELVGAGEQSTTVDRSEYAGWLNSRPAAFEERAIALLTGLAEETGCRVHVVHLADGNFKRRDPGRFPLSFETCPHYLYFAAEEIAAGATEFKCAPPIRSATDREQLWQLLLDGTIEMVVSDHSPCLPSMKCRDTGDFFKAWGGIASLQLGPSIVWTETVKRGGSLEKLARWMSSRPAELAGLESQKGQLAPGYDADVVIFDPDKDWTVSADRLFHRHKLTPYDGARLKGLAVATYLRGELLYREGGFVGSRSEGKTLVR